MAVKGWIGFVAVFAGVLLAVGAGFFYWKISGNRKCEVELVSESKVIKVEVVDKEKFYKFITDYIPCERGYFTAGYPVNIEGPYKLRKIVWNFTDLPQKSRVRPNASEEPMMSFDYEFFPDEKYVNVNAQIEEEYMSWEHFSRHLAYFIASRADSMYKFNDREEWITGKQDDYKFRAEEIGLSYQAVL